MMEVTAAFLLDPVVTRAVGAALAVVLLAGAWHKLRDIAVFAAAVENYRLLPSALVPAVAWTLPVLESAAGVLILFADTRVAGGALAALVLAATSGAVAINLLRGHTAIDCGCGGLSSQPLSWSLVARNVVLLALVVLAVQDDLGRPLVWADYFTAGGAVLALLGLYSCINQLMSNAPFMSAVRK